MRSRRMPRAHHASRSHTCGGGSRAVFHQRCRKSKGSMWTNFILYVYSYPALPSPSLFFCNSLMTSLTSSLPPPYLTKMGTTNHSYPNWSPYPGLMTSSLRCISTRFLMGGVHIGMVLGVRCERVCIVLSLSRILPGMRYPTLSVIIYTSFN